MVTTSFNATQITPPRVPIIDDRTGLVSREWYRYFYSLYAFTGGGTGILPIPSGGTGLGTIPTDGQLLIGDTASSSYKLHVIDTGAGIAITNGSGTILITNTGVLSNIAGSGIGVSSATGDVIISNTGVLSAIAGSGISVSSATGNVTFANTGVLSFSGGSTGLLPSSATTGAVSLSGTLGVGYGGTGQTTYTNGQLLIGNTTGNTLTKTTLTAGSGVTISNGAGSITISATGSGGTVTAVTATTPILSSGGTTPDISIPAATTSVSGYLTSTDWNTFNGKQPAGTYVTSITVTSSNGLAGTVTSGATPAITLSTSITGILKGNGTAISAATSGTDYAPATSGSAILYGNGAGGFSNVTIGTGVSFAGGTLSATGSGGTVTSVTGTAPVVSSGGATPAISMAAATTSVNGYLTSTDWTTFNGKQAALVSGTNIKTVNGTTLLGSGDVGTITYAYGGTGQTTVTTGDLLYGSTANTWSKLAVGTTGQILRVVSGAPAWGTDYVGTVTSVGGTGTVNGITLTGTVTSSGNLTLGGTLSGVSLTTQVSGVLPVANGGTNASTASITSFNNITGYTASGATGTTSTNLVFSTSPSITTPTLVGDATLSTGNLVVSNGKGIDFSATPGTGTSELLADYEEGTWTPVGNGVSLTVTQASYVKVGTLVGLRFDITYPVGVNANAADIGGLPFAVSGNGGASIGYLNGGLELHFNAGGSATLQVYINNGTAPTNAQLSGSRVMASCLLVLN
jgi:hypothetical protein